MTLALRPRVDRIPEVEGLISADAIDIDEAGMALGAVADKARIHAR